MKKGLAVILAMVMALLMAGSAVAEGTQTKVYAKDYEFNQYADSVGFKLEGDSVWTLVDAHGKPLTTAPYRTMYANSYFPLFSVEVDAEDGLHDEGLIDAGGRELVPPEYVDVEVVSEKWQIAVKCVDATAEDYDFSVISFGSSDKKYIKIDTADVYYDGTRVGSLTREDYAGRNTAYGDYICIRSRDGAYRFYNKNMELSPWEAKNGDEYVEATVNGRGAVVHQGSGKTAFTADCDLTTDEVASPYWFQKGAVVNLQGEEVFRPEDNGDEYTVRDGFLVAYRWADKSFYGLYSLSGQKILPSEYDNFASNDLAALAKFGFGAVRKDKAYGIVDLNGNLLVPCEYSSEEKFNSAGTLIYQKQEDGTYRIITPSGELEEKYSEFRGSYDGMAAFVAERQDGTSAMISLAGEEVIPFGEGNVVGVNVTGTLALTRDADNNFTLRVFETEKAEPAAETEEAGEDGTWTCVNGHEGQAGKFCSECGSPRP